MSKLTKAILTVTAAALLSATSFSVGKTIGYYQGRSHGLLEGARMIGSAIYGLRDRAKYAESTMQQREILNEISSLENVQRYFPSSTNNSR